LDTYQDSSVSRANQKSSVEYITT
jgi:hypothetical protein